MRRAVTLQKGALGRAGVGEHSSCNKSVIETGLLGWYSAEDESKLQEVALVTMGSSRERALSPVTLL